MYKKYEKYYNVISSKKKEIILFCILEGKKTACKNLACNGRARTEKIVDSKLGRGGEEGEFSSSNEIQNFGCSRQESDAAE